MADTFDPYHRWLSIPPEEQPPNHYRLLGLKVLERDLDVIESAADRQMTHVRTFQGGKYADDSQRILNEISTAKVTLLDPSKKKSYDAALTAKLEDAKRAKRAERPLAVAQSLPAAPAPLPSGQPAAAQPPAAQPPTVAPPMSLPAANQVSRANPQVSASQRRKRSGLSPVALAAIGGIALAVVAALGALALIARPWESSTETVRNTAAENPADDTQPTTPDDATKTPPVVQPPSVTPPPVVPPVTTPEEPPAEPPPEESPDEEELPVEPPDVPEIEIDEEVEIETEAPPPRAPVPTKAEREAKLASVEAVLPTAKAKAPAEKAALARQLLRTASETPDDLVAQFVMLNLARELAADAAHMQLAFDAIDLLDEQFEIDGDAVRISTIAQGAKALVPNEMKQEVVALGVELADHLAAADRHEDASRVLTGLIELARRARELQLSAALVERRRVSEARLAAYRKVQASIDALKNSPDDPTANLAVGRYLLFAKNDAARGLTHLAKGSDEPLAGAAKLELTNPQTPAEQEQLASAWWDLAAQATDKDEQKNLKSRSFAWYQRVQPELKGLDAAKADKRLQELADAGVQPADINLDLGVFDDDPRGTATTSRLPSNLLDLVDPAKHALSQKWSRVGRDISAPKSFAALLKIPATIDGGYDATLEFTRTDGGDIVGLVFPVGEQTCELMLSVGGGDLGGLAQIDGKPLAEGPATFSPCRLTNGQRYALRARVALRGDQAVIDVTLDGKPLLHWEGAASSLSVGSYRDVRAPKHFGLYANDAAVSFHSLKLLTRSGRATPDADAVLPRAARPSTATADAPRPINLLPKINPKADSIVGPWDIQNGALRAPIAPHARVRVPVDPGEEYDLRLVVEPTRPERSLVVGLVGPGKQKFAATFQCWDGGKFTGLEFLDDKPSFQNETAYDKPVFNDGRNTIVCSVRKSGVRITVNDKQVVDWQGDFARLGIDRNWDIADNPGLFVGAYNSGFWIHTLTLTPFEPASVRTPVGARSDVTRGLVAHWKFDDGKGSVATDAAGKSNGEVRGATWVKGIHGGALRFDGKDDLVLIGQPQALDLTGEITVSLFVRPQSATPPRGEYPGVANVIARGFVMNPEREFAVRQLRPVDGGPAYWNLQVSDDANRVGVDAPQIELEKWTHVVVVYDGSAWKFYTSGKLQATEASQVSMPRFDGDWAIGGHASDARTFHGDIDDVRIYNRGLSSDEVKTLYLGRSSTTAGVPRDPPREPTKGLVGHWKFDEGKGTVASDAVGGHAATIKGTAWAKGIRGHALHFDGQDDVVEIGNPAELNFEGDISLAAWTRVNKLPESNRRESDLMNIVLHCWKDPERKEVYLRLVNRGSAIQIEAGGYAGEEKHATFKVDDDVVDKWVHWCATYDGDAWTIYRNGSAVARQPSQVGALKIDSSWCIGSQVSGDRIFDGDIDDVRIYNRALTDDEVQSLFESGSAPDDQQGSHPAVAARPTAPLPRVTVTRAIYGAGSSTVDVTDLVRAALTRDPFAPVQADDRSMGDPASGKQKELVITYAVAGKPQTVRLNQQTPVPLPQLPETGMATSDASKEFRVLSARYGAGLTWIDITEAVRGTVTRTDAAYQWSFQDSDPWFGVAKRSSVWFDFKGKRYHRFFTDGETQALLP